MWYHRAEVRRLLRRVRDLEARVSGLEFELQEERMRNRRREDELVDRVLTASGRHAITPEPKTVEKRHIEQPMTAMDEARLTAFREAAVRSGRPASDGDTLWRAQRNGQTVSVGLPDEPYVLPQ